MNHSTNTAARLMLIISLCTYASLAELSITVSHGVTHNTANPVMAGQISYYTLLKATAVKSQQKKHKDGQICLII